MGAGQSDRERLASLTPKQREVLDLLLEHKTSKEIARALGISPHTVDQRMRFARAKLGVSTRGETALAYRRLLDLCERSTYGDARIVSPPPHGDTSPPANRRPARPPEHVPGTDAPEPVVRGAFDGRHGTWLRLAAIAGIATMLVLLVVGALAVMAQLAQLMRR